MFCIGPVALLGFSPSIGLPLCETPVELMPFEFHKKVLDNDLTVIAECNGDAHTAAVGFFVKTGTRDEIASEMGVSHFLEHMMFKGTQRRSADDVNRAFDDIGANYNAFTSHEQTVYFAQVLPEYLSHAIDLLGDILRPSLRDDDFEMEKKVIVEEIGMYDDRPSWRLQDAMLETYFGGHTLGYRVLGTPATVGQLTATQMRLYFEQRYASDNIIVVGAGRIDFDAFVDDVRQIAGQWCPAGVTRDYVDPQPAVLQRSIRDQQVTRHYLALMCLGPSAQDDLRYTARVLADVLGDADGSRLYWDLVDPGLADEADFSFLPYDRTGSYFGYASCAPDRASEVESRFIETIDAVAGAVTADEVERVKNKLATAATVVGERPLGRMRYLGGQWSYLGQYLPLVEELHRLMEVSVGDLHDLMDRMPFEPKTIVRLTPVEQPN